MLYPQTNKSRLVINLNGLWEFKTVSDDYLPAVKASDTYLMAVPASINELTVDKNLRDYVGKVLYERFVELPPLPKDCKLFFRLGAASHHKDIYIDGEFVGHHKGGFMPCEFEIKNKTSFRLTIMLDNRLDNTCLPYGEVKDGKQTIHHDFYNFTGIHRDVLLYTTPAKRIEDITISSVLEDGYALVNYDVDCLEQCTINIYDPQGKNIGSAKGNQGTIKVDNPKLWDIGQGNLYVLEVISPSDTYKEKFGIRKIEVKDQKIFLNNRPIYLKGFGKHEDFAILGKANNSAVNLRDFNCMKWINANSFRTSHYPYCEEIYDIADREGFLVIDEVPAVGFNFWSGTKVFCPERVNNETLAYHKASLKEIIDRDKNHPSIILLSCGNEAASYEEEAGIYFKEIADYTRTVSPWPLMIVENVNPLASKTSQYFDVIGINKYNAWYNNHGDLDVIPSQLSADLEKWNAFKKPIVLTEFGADTIEGNHYLPSESFSEEFQMEYLDEMTKVIDQFESVVGEHIWNFADFKTKQGLTRVRGNRKGVFTRARQPKLAAHFIKQRWEKL